MAILPYGVIDLADVPGLDFFGFPTLKLPLNLSCVSAVLGQEVPGNHQVVPVIGNPILLQNLKLAVPRCPRLLLLGCRSAIHGAACYAEKATERHTEP